LLRGQKRRGLAWKRKGGGEQTSEIEEGKCSKAAVDSTEERVDAGHPGGGCEKLNLTRRLRREQGRPGKVRRGNSESGRSYLDAANERKSSQKKTGTGQERNKKQIKQPH